MPYVEQFVICGFCLFMIVMAVLIYRRALFIWREINRYDELSKGAIAKRKMSEYQ